MMNGDTIGDSTLPERQSNHHPSAGKVHIEIALKQTSKLTIKSEAINAAKSFLLTSINKVDGFNPKQFTESDFFHDPFLTSHVHSIDVQTDNAKIVALEQDGSNMKFYVFRLDSSGGLYEEMENGEEQVNAAKHWLLPSEEFHGLWESLIFDSNIKSSLLQYVETTMVFSNRKVNANLISWNRVVLLHGPPGTGKTSLCRALAQKLSIRMSRLFSYAQLVEINSHSLFSKWFSESGKLVQKMFDQIHEIIEDPKALVIVLIDEVESLAAARNASSSEPSDAIRVVNAVLTQIDNIKHFGNVIILTTSNITGSIDLAFVDRADIKKFIGLPSEQAIYTMLEGSIEELTSKYLLSSSYILSYPQLQEMIRPDDIDQPLMQNSLKLLSVSRKSVGLSGRTMRKLPFLAYAKLIEREGEMPLETFEVREMIEALDEVVSEQHSDREHF